MGTQEAIKLMANAVKPWSEVFSTEREYKGYDNQREIKGCLMCQKVECDNCLYRKEQAAKGRPLKANPSLLEYFAVQGMSVKEICETLNISRKTYYNYKKKGKKDESK